MDIWQTYPVTYREAEVQRIARAVRAGACVSVVGPSGAGKSNLLGFLAQRRDAFPFPACLVDGNRLRQPTPEALLRLTRICLGGRGAAEDELLALEAVLRERLEASGAGLCLLFDRFDPLADDLTAAANLRALRDTFKYRLTFVLATRRPLSPQTELAELVFGHSLYLGVLSESDARWNVQRFAARLGQTWDERVVERLCALSGRYPALLKALCEALADGAPLEAAALRRHPAVRQRVDEFWRAAPSANLLRACGLEALPLLQAESGAAAFSSAHLTRKEHLLLTYLQAHSGQVCDKEALIRAVWPEDVIYEQGVRDDSLAQLVRRVRRKIEPDPSQPVHLLTVPGRGYRFVP